MTPKKEYRGSRPRPKLDEIGFVIIQYRQGIEFPVAELPCCCPYCEEKPDTPCNVRFHHLRLRKTGSVPKIVVCECTGHSRGFSLYPPGGIPYSRVRWNPLSPNGESIRVKEEPPPSQASRELSSRLTNFVPTYPGAAIDESRGVLWPTGATWQDPPGNTLPRRETQVRRSQRALRVLGIDGNGVNEREQFHLSELLGIPRSELRKLEQELIFVGERGAQRARGMAVCNALEALPNLAPLCLAHRLAIAGHLAGVWGLSWTYDVKRGTFATEPFRRSGKEVAAM